MLDIECQDPKLRRLEVHVWYATPSKDEATYETRWLPNIHEAPQAWPLSILV